MPPTSFLDRTRAFLARQWVLLLALLLYLPLVFFGYGSDVDTFRVLDAGRNFFATADYVPSRRPGYLVYELAVFVLNHLGGSVLTNLGSLFWALVAVACFRRILLRHRIANAGLLTLILVMHPVFWYNATVSIDYLWALGMLLAGFDFLEQDRYGWAGLALGLAVGCRLSSIIIVAGLLGYAWLRAPQKRLLVTGCAALAGLLGGLAYILPWDFAEWRPSFWRVSAGSAELWSPIMQVGRFAYKNLYFWGIPAGLFLVALLIYSIRNSSSWKRPGALLLAMLACFVLLGSEILFFRFPIEVEYLLPLLPFWLLLVGLGTKSRRILGVFFILVLSFNFININLARPDAPGQASSARAGVWIEPGYFLEQMHVRLELIGCDSHACYDERISQRPALR
ncbi:MAG: hypothetical protein IH586_02350 [Anaerolineaceae bacterium]|nr:hypothetical protein [Anaerolineaceae bacterium]